MARTFPHFVITKFIQLLHPNRYLEIGLGSGKNLEAIPIKEKVGIDPKFTTTPSKTYRGLSDNVFESALFRQNEPPFDLIFVDGLHEYSQTVRDIENAMKCLSSKGIILVHDVNPLDQPDSVSAKEKPGRSATWCGDVWKTVLHVRYLMLGYSFVTIEEFPGWLVIWKGKRPRSRKECPFKVNLKQPYPFGGVLISQIRAHRPLMSFTSLQDALSRVKGTILKEKVIKEPEKPIIPHIAGAMAIYNFPMAEQMIESLAKHVDTLCLRFDSLNGNVGLWNKILDDVVPKLDCVVITMTSEEPWNRWNWREDLIRMLDPIEPSIVLTPDEDERFEDLFELELAEFWKSSTKLMMFNYRMVTEDDVEVEIYPRARHCKAFKWQPGITYRPYRGYAKPTTFVGLDRSLVHYAQTRMLHYCFFTEALRKAKVLHK